MQRKNPEKQLLSGLFVFWRKDKSHIPWLAATNKATTIHEHLQYMTAGTKYHPQSAAIIGARHFTSFYSKENPRIAVMNTACFPYDRWCGCQQRLSGSGLGRCALSFEGGIYCYFEKKHRSGYFFLTRIGHLMPLLPAHADDPCQEKNPGLGGTT